MWKIKIKQVNLIKEFFEVYKRMEPNKWVKVEGFADKERAIKEVEKINIPHFRVIQRKDEKIIVDNIGLVKALHVEERHKTF